MARNKKHIIIPFTTQVYCGIIEHHRIANYELATCELCKKNYKKVMKEKRKELKLKKIIKK